MSSENVSSYKIEDVDAFGKRLHINTLLSVFVNGLAMYLILTHSSKSISVYKYYILSTVVSAFLMDFHLTFIFGLFPLFPKCAVCAAGIVRHAGQFWGNTVQYSLFHFTLSFCGLSLLFGFLYQYLSIINKAHFLQTPQGYFTIWIIKLIYPLPSFYLFITNSNYDLYLNELKTTEPELVPFFIAASCNGYTLTKSIAIYLAVGVLQIMIIVIIVGILETKLIRLMSKMKDRMSESTLKIRKQLFIVLAIQMAAPFLIIILPLILVVILISLDIRNDTVNQICIQILSLHSVANALIVIFATKCYRQVLLRWLARFIRKLIKLNQKLFENQINNSRAFFVDRQ